MNDSVSCISPAPPCVSDSIVTWATAVAVCIAGLVAYSSTFSNDFVWDDASSVLLNKHIQDPRFLGQLFLEDQHPFGRGQGNFYRPLLAATFMLDFALSYSPPADGAPEAGIPKVSPFVFHLTSLAWHLSAALLLLVLLSRLRAPVFVRVAVPLVYVVHPLHTEAVAYISGRADMMSATFLFAALAFALWDASPIKRAIGATLASLCFIGGLLSKESATIFPILLLLFVVLRPAPESERKAEYLRRAIPLVPALVLLAVYAYLRTTVLKFASASAPETSFGGRLLETCQAFGYYIRLIFVPTSLHMERTFSGIEWGMVLLGAISLAACVAAFALSLRSGQRRIALGIGWFLATWFPVSGLIPLNAPMAEHWMYVPLAGFLWALAEAAALGWQRPAVRTSACLAAWAAGVCFLALTVARNKDWRDNETIFRDTLAKNPNSIRVHYNLAVTYEDLLKNEAGARRHYESVLALYKEQKKRGPSARGAVSFWDEELESHLSLGRIFFEQGQFNAAAEHYMAVVSISPDEAHRPMIGAAALNLGKCYVQMGDGRRAGEAFKKALSIDPGLKPEIQRIIGGLTGNA